MLLISVNANSTNANKYVSIEKHVLNNSLMISIQGVGGHSAYCIQINANNLTSDTLYVYIEPGRRLVSKDTTIQDILIVKENKIIIFPYDKSTFLAYGFCCQASNSSPYSASTYSIGHMAPPDWITLAKLINENTFPDNAIQSAVWVMSNNHPVSSIISNDMESISLLRETVANIKGIEIPWYSVEFEEDSILLFSNRHEKFKGNIKYYLNTKSIISIIVRKSDGKLMTIILDGKMQEQGLHTSEVAINVLGWPKGEYGIYVYQDYSNLKKKVSFKL